METTQVLLLALAGVSTLSAVVVIEPYGPRDHTPLCAVQVVLAVLMCAASAMAVTMVLVP
jgi:hypothetical protein